MLTFWSLHTNVDTMKVHQGVGISNGPVWVPSNAFQFVLIGKF